MLTSLVNACHQHAGGIFGKEREHRLLPVNIHLLPDICDNAVADKAHKIGVAVIKNAPDGVKDYNRQPYHAQHGEVFFKKDIIECRLYPGRQGLLMTGPGAACRSPPAAACASEVFKLKQTNIDVNAF